MEFATEKEEVIEKDPASYYVPEFCILSITQVPEKKVMQKSKNKCPLLVSYLTAANIYMLELCHNPYTAL